MWLLFEFYLSTDIDNINISAVQNGQKIRAVRDVGKSERLNLKNLSSMPCGKDLRIFKSGMTGKKK